MLKLRFTNNPQSAVWLVEPKVVLGSSATCDLVLNDAGVHSQYAEILVDHEDLQFLLLSESSITSINNKVIEPRSPVPLAVGDKLRIGKSELEVIDPKQESQVPVSAPAPQATSGWALKANHTALSNRVYPINTEVTVGRSSDCDITLAAAHLSRHHAQFTFRDDALYVRDLGSSNGTYLNGKRVTEARVKRGDELRFDTLSFGVIGPSDDLDKTTVRSVAVAGRSSVAASGKVVEVPPQGRTAVTVHSKHKARVATNSEIAKSSQESIETVRRAEVTAEPSGHSSGSRLTVGVGLLIIIAGGAYFVWQNLWVPG